MILEPEKFMIRCIRCKTENISNQFKLINQFAMLESECNKCHKKFASMLPIDNHASINYPFIVDLETLNYKGDLNDYTKRILRCYYNRRNISGEGRS
ncbi:unnamed protein product, partial [marine sediment metagenome]